MDEWWVFHITYIHTYIPAVPQYSLCNILRSCLLPDHRPLYPLTGKIISCLSRSLPPGHLPLGNRLAGVGVERLVCRWEIWVCEWLPALAEGRRVGPSLNVACIIIWLTSLSTQHEAKLLH